MTRSQDIITVILIANNNELHEKLIEVKHCIEDTIKQNKLSE